MAKMCDCRICTALRDLQQQYEQAVAAKIAIGHDDDPDCDCPVCDRERELYFIEKHFLDDLDPAVKAHMDRRPQAPEPAYPTLSDDEIPF
jgi:hypothetical protein